ncbi:MAG: DUF1565 domain-containing protein [Verrucomicrobia bacterium]|jgi:hypothetical protein|nr:DUF1565 domain-containing protein [Verrucomicrobiota bacterium]MBT7068436.1 DUF1565 domain-containing protein [Verrucomicrobiota bacterium]MBT7698996.1 DUF1565 domain-containing protein [Verrucomicrobiota bacterium]
MRDITRFTAIICLTVNLCAGLAHGETEFTAIQAAINVAAVGDVVNVPAGTYSESIVIKDGIVLCGAGAESTIIDGAGAKTVVTCGKGSAIMGFTVQNGVTGVFNAGNFIGVSDCIIQDMSAACVQLTLGSALISNNILVGGGKQAHGIVSAQANPIISGNVIFDHAGYGILGTHHFVLTISGNIIAGNGTGVRCTVGAEAILADNVFDLNVEHVHGVELGGTDTTNAVDLATAIPYRQPPARDEIRAAMARAYDVVVGEHAALIYTLSEVPGTFNMTTLYPWATFTIRSTTKDTAIDAYAAHDLVELTEISASCTTSPIPRFIVKNEALVAKELDRYALTSTFIDPQSYATNATGQLVFSRLTNLSNISVVGPAGYDVVSVSHPHTASTAEGRTTVSIVDMGHSAVKVVLEPSDL